MSLLTHFKAFDAIADQDRAVLRGWYGGTPLARVEAASTGAEVTATDLGPLCPSIHQPLHHGSDSHGSVGSLGSIHDTEVRHS